MKDRLDRMLAAIKKEKEAGKSPGVLLQVLKGWNHKGTVLPPGSLVVVEKKVASRIKRLGYAREMGEDEPFKYPASDASHGFQQVVIDGDEVKAAECNCDELDNETEIDALDFLNDVQRAALRENGIVLVLDLRNWDIDKLVEIHGVGKSTATKLIKVYDARYGNGYVADNDVDVTTK